jgi:Tfp pilus assembly PilM family ATPase
MLAFTPTKAKASLGIDLNSHSAQLIIKRANSHEAPELISIPLPEQLFSAGILMEPVPLSQQLAVALKSQTFQRVILNIPAQWVTAYFLPLTSELGTAELELIIELDIKQRLNLNRTDYYRDYWLVSATQVFIVVCAKAIIDSRLVALKLLRLSPQQVTTTYSVMARQLIHKSSSIPMAMIYLELRCINLVVVAQAQLIHFETIAILDEDIGTIITDLFAELHKQYGAELIIELVGVNLLTAKEQQQLAPFCQVTHWSIAQGLVEFMQ